jgi:hypothetical protein
MKHLQTFSTVPLRRVIKKKIDDLTNDEVMRVADAVGVKFSLENESG